MAAPKITLVDDDRNITTSVAMALKAEGFQVQVYNDGEEGLAGIKSNIPDLAILDIKMPKMDGIELVQKLRKDYAFPIIFLTSKDDEIDEIIGLRMGADDYVTKPFSQRLLMERIKTLLRRQELMKPSEDTKEAGSIEGNTHIRGPLTLDDDRHICSWRNERLNLTVTEYILIRTLSENPGHVKSRDQLIDAAYGESTYVDDRTIDSHIKRLRKKFRDVDPTFNQIETLYGVGYKYKDPAE
jgi:two-component system response regulator ChvI